MDLWPAGRTTTLVFQAELLLASAAPEFPNFESEVPMLMFKIAMFSYPLFAPFSRMNFSRLLGQRTAEG